jgi:hypothetical protein
MVTIAVLLIGGAGTATVMLQAQDKYYNYDLPLREDGLVPIPYAAEKFPVFLSKLGGTQNDQLKIHIGLPVPDNQGKFSSDSISKMPVTISGPKGDIMVDIDRGMSGLFLEELDDKKVITGDVSGEAIFSDGTQDFATISIVAFPEGQASFNVAVSGLFLAFGDLKPTDDLLRLVVPEKYLPLKNEP